MNKNHNNITSNIKEIAKIENGARYKIIIKIPMSDGWIENVKFVVESKHERKAFQLNHYKNEGEYAYFTSEVDLPTKALYHYYFSYTANGMFKYFKKRNNTNDQTIAPDEKWQMSVNFEVPDWAQGKIMYHIFPDRFYKARKEKLIELPRRNIHTSWNEKIQAGPDKDGIWCNDFYGGDLKGIEKKLDYIKSLGVSIIYLGPIVLSQSNHRYDAANYEEIDPYVGTKEDLKNLCDCAHKMGIRIILDGVFNHTGNDSKYFNEFGTYNTTGAYQSKKSPYYPFYRKYEDGNNVYFDYWWGYKDKVVCDGYNKNWRNYICGIGGVIDQWFALGIDGLRLDVADELLDEYIEDIRTAVKRNKEDGFIIGEVWKNPFRERRNYINSGKGMDAVMNYHLIDALFRYYKYKDPKYVNKLKDVMYQLATEYAPDSLNSSMIFTSTHDTSRAINLFGCNEFTEHKEWGWDLYNDDIKYQCNYKLSKEQYEYGKKLYKNYTFNLAFFPGTFSIFYGDEIGMEGLGNIACRRPYPWNGTIDYDLLHHFQYLGKIRNSETHLEKAEFYPVDITDKYIMYERLSAIEDNLVIISNTNDIINTPIPGKYLKSQETHHLYESNSKSLDSYGALVLKK